jgi:CheY-like chemotaxis protein
MASRRGWAEREERVNSRPRILVVDESEDNCVMMAALLGQVGYVADAAHSVACALKAARNQRPSLYVLETYFSDGNGADLCRQLCADDPQAAIIFYSSRIDRADREAAQRAGAQAYVIKPDIDGLLRRIADLSWPTGREC